MVTYHGSVRSATPQAHSIPPRPDARPTPPLPIIYFGQTDGIENFPLSTKEIHVLMLLEGLFFN